MENQEIQTPEKNRSVFVYISVPKHLGPSSAKAAGDHTLQRPAAHMSQAEKPPNFRPAEHMGLIAQIVSHSAGLGVIITFGREAAVVVCRYRRHAR